jgi:tRNA-dihydrouridine synthase B
VRIGPYLLSNNVFAAPMAGVTDRPFRQLCKRLGAGYAVSEMATANALLWNSAKTLRRIDHCGESAPIAVQLAGADPHTLAEAARFNVDRGAQIIDINMGCPAKKVCNVAAGSALLKNEALVARILAEVVGAVAVPVTLKIRTGWDPAHRNAVRIAHIAQDSGIAMLTIHGRTRACGYTGSAEYDTIADVKTRVDIPIVANGDIRSPEQARDVLRHTGADAVMIGRAAQGRPWLFGEIDQFLQTGRRILPPRITVVREIMLEHLRDHYQFHGEEVGVKTARKHIGWYVKDIPGAAAFRELFNNLDSSTEQLHSAEQFFLALAERQERLPKVNESGHAVPLQCDMK